jgi:hypothetical protein
MLPVRLRHLRPQAFGALAAAIPHVKGNHLATLGIHGDPDPLLLYFLLDTAGHFIRFHLKASQHGVAVTGDGLDLQMIQQCLNALGEKTR